MAPLAILRRTLLQPLPRVSNLLLCSSSSFHSFKVIANPATRPSGRQQFSITRAVTMASRSHFLDTSGESDAVWIHTDPYSNRPQFPALTEDIKTDVCVIGSGIAGTSVAYELVQRGVKVVMLEARGILSGESGDS